MLLNAILTKYLMEASNVAWMGGGMDGWGFRWFRSWKVYLFFKLCHNVVGSNEYIYRNKNNINLHIYWKLRDIVS